MSDFIHMGFDSFRINNYDKITIFSIRDDRDEIFVLPNLFNYILRNTNCDEAVERNVSEKNQREYHKLIRSSALRRLITWSCMTPQTKFINEDGLYELIDGSKSHQANEFRDWIKTNFKTLKQPEKYAIDLELPKGHGTWYEEKLKFMERLSMKEQQLETEYLDLEKKMKLVEEELVVRSEIPTICALRNRCLASTALIRIGLQDLLTENSTQEIDVERALPQEQYKCIVCYEYPMPLMAGFTEPWNIFKITLETRSSSRKRKLVPEFSWKEKAIEVFCQKTTNTTFSWDDVQARFPQTFYGIKNNEKTNNVIRYLTEQEIRTKFREQATSQLFDDEDEAVNLALTLPRDSRKATVVMLDTVLDESQ